MRSGRKRSSRERNEKGRNSAGSRLMLRRSRARRARGMTRKGRAGRRVSYVVLSAAVLIAVTAVICAARYAFLFIIENDRTAEEPYPVKGVDVSSYQLDIDWEGLEDEGFKFAFIKATEGVSLVDDRFEYNWREANRTDMKVGAYHFLSYDAGGKEQAERYIDTVSRKWGMLPPVVDVELYGEYSGDPPDKERVEGILGDMLDELERHYHKKPIIYTNMHVYDLYISGVYDGYPIWISSPDVPAELSDGRTWMFCQYTFEGRSENVAGGEKKVDMDVFNGSSWDLRKHEWK